MLNVRERRRMTVFILLCICLAPPSSASFLGAGTAVMVSSVYAGWNYAKCWLYECCTDRWATSNFTELYSTLKLKLHGQPLVRQIVVPYIVSHRKSEDPRKALVLSFHGWTGGGKNFVSKIIAENLFTKGMKSNYVHLFIARRDFPYHDKVDEYKKTLQEKIEKSVKECERTLFIFDEIDDIPPGLIDALKPYIDFHEHIDGVDYRKAIYIFLSNTGGNGITKIVYDFWKLGKSRDTITLKDMESLVQKGAFNEIGGLKNSEIIAKHLIDAYVPFFPLERQHIKLCAKDDLIAKGRKYDEEIANNLADEMTYFPSDSKLFSISGCKLVTQKVDLLLTPDFEL